MSGVATAAIYETASIYELDDAELDAVSAGKAKQVALAQLSFGNIAIGIQVNNQVNIAVLSAGAIQGGSQTNINNAGNLITYSLHS
jgi:ABC-type transport system involved in cytochrome c biogenesis ATPase subunit